MDSVQARTFSVMKNHSIFKSFIFCLIMLSHGCVTINIYFPAAAAEKAADKVIDEIWQIPADGQGTSNNTQTPSENKQPATTGGEK